MSAIKSYQHLELCSNRIQQALARRTHIVATDCSRATSEILEVDKWGRLVLVRNQSAIAEAIIFASQDKSHPDGSLRAADFDPKRNAKDYPNYGLPDFIPHPTLTVVR